MSLTWIVVILLALSLATITADHYIRQWWDHRNLEQQMAEHIDKLAKERDRGKHI